MARAVELCDQAAGEGAELIMFPEAWFPGYPTWIWRTRPGGDIGVAKDLHARLLANSVDVAGGGLSPLQDAAKAHGVTITAGINEIDSEFSGSTLFNSAVVIGPDGGVLNRHRKLMPTNPERMVWGFGDGRGLRVVETPAGRMGVLICWESYMPLARFALYAQDIDIYLAPTWDVGEGWLASMRHIAREGGCWVISAATSLQASDIPADLPHRDKVFPDPDEWINSGDAVVIKPFGGPVAGPMSKEKGILYADIDPAEARDARRSLDVAGHYGRPDVFKLEVDRAAKPPVIFSGDGVK
jgi:nitrilase